MDINKYLTKETIDQMVKYAISAGISYVGIFTSLFILVDLLDLNPSLSFALVYAVAYIVMFFVYVKHIFKTKASSMTVVRYAAHLIVFYLLNNLVFNFFEGVLGLNYIISLCLNIGILFPLRFLSSKFFVFKG